MIVYKFFHSIVVFSRFRLLSRGKKIICQILRQYLNISYTKNILLKIIMEDMGSVFDKKAKHLYIT